MIINKIIKINDASINTTFILNYELEIDLIQDNILDTFRNQIDIFYQTQVSLDGKFDIDESNYILDTSELLVFMNECFTKMYGSIVKILDIMAFIECNERTVSLNKIFNIRDHSIVADVTTTIYYQGSCDINNAHDKLISRIDRESVNWIDDGCPYDQNTIVNNKPFSIGNCPIIKSDILITGINNQITNLQINKGKINTLFMLLLMVPFTGFLASVFALIIIFINDKCLINKRNLYNALQDVFVICSIIVVTAGLIPSVIIAILSYLLQYNFSSLSTLLFGSFGLIIYIISTCFY